MNRRSRGFSIVTALVAVALVALLGFTLVGLSITHLGLVARTSASQQAECLARSTVSTAIARVLEDRTYGTHSVPAEDLVVHLEGIQGEGRLSFRQETATGWSVPLSVNNLRGTHAVPGGGNAPVPVAAVQLIGVGESGGVRRVVEATLVINPFSYALAARGPVRSLGRVLVAGMPESGTLPTDLEELEPADLVSNSQADDSISLASETTVSGNVRASGGVVLNDTNIRVLGEVRSHEAPEDLPDLQPDQYDPANLGLDYENYNGSQSNDRVVLSGTVRSEGSLEFDRGLDLEGATLYVDGDLTVRGGLTGAGVVLVTGTTRIGGGTQLETESQVAVLSAGDILLDGHGPASSRFRGLLYTRGGVRVEQISVVGTLIALGESGVSLQDTNIFQELLHPTTPDTGGTEAVLGRYDIVVNQMRGGDRSSFDVVGHAGESPMIEVRHGPGGYTLIAGDPIPPVTYSGLSEEGLRARLMISLTQILSRLPFPGPIVDLDPEVIRLAGRIEAEVIEGGGGSPGGGGGESAYGPSEFLRDFDTIRLAYWREY